MDGTHPQHNTMPAYGWIKQGEAKRIKTQPDGSGSISWETQYRGLECRDAFRRRINAQATLGLLAELERRHSEAKTIYVICDNAGYYRSTLVSRLPEGFQDRASVSSPYSRSELD